MLTPKKPQSKSEAKRLASQQNAFAKVQEQKEMTPAVAPVLKTNPNLPPCIIVDIDGTLSKRGGRGVYDFNKSIDDERYLQIAFLLELIAEQNRWKNPVVPSMEIILISGREQQFSDVTNRWLNRHQIPFNHIYMRRTADKRPAYIVKEEIYTANIRGKYNVFFVLEDNLKCIDMYRSHGLYCLIPDNSREYRVV